MWRLTRPPVTVTAGEGVLGSVTMVNSDGKEIAGEIGPDGVTWTTTEPLGYDKQYTINADARGLGGVARGPMRHSEPSRPTT